MSRTPDPGKMLAAWQQGMSRSQQKFKDGINAVNVNPMQLAAAKVSDGTWAANCAAAAPRMASALQAADPGFWKSQTMGAGAAAWAAGAAKGAPKYQRKAQQLAQAAAAGSAAAAAATGPMAKMQANMNAFRAAFGKSPL